jgi:hypothetical protein
VAQRIKQLLGEAMQKKKMFWSLNNSKDMNVMSKWGLDRRREVNRETRPLPPLLSCGKIFHSDAALLSPDRPNSPLLSDISILEGTSIDP